MDDNIVTIDTYLDNAVIFTDKEFYDLVFPGLYYELKQNTKLHKDFLISACSSSRYKLPDTINSDDLINAIRTTCAGALLFIHSWAREHEDIDFLDQTYNTYEEFFDACFGIIIACESCFYIRDLAVDYNFSMKKLYKYFGSYHGNLSQSVYKKADLIALIVTLVLIATR